MIPSEVEHELDRLQTDVLMLTSHKSPWGAGLVVLPHLRDLEALETRRELLVGARRPGRRGSHALLPGTEQTLGEEP